MACPYFAAFCLRSPDGLPSRIGLTLPRALGNAVTRNRIKRRTREAVRLSQALLGEGWLVVLNLRKPALNVQFARLRAEVERLFHRCGM